ncbi:fasciclin domain-containing protein [Sphingorhabdus contaminans]|uniref:fasciclin domain-containing protein n=1 Tax=Sphingorhabdus contaminans TaxID=1343899 RepID=UPI003D2C9103
MKSMKIALISTMSALSLAACSNETPADPVAADTEIVQDETAGDTMVAQAPVGDQTIVGLAQNNPQASTLVSALTAAGLVETLNGAGPFTVFAPSNDAFAKVDKATLDGLMKPESKGKLGDILKYHVVSGNLKSGDIAQLITAAKGMASIKTLNGGSLKASMDGDKIILTDAKGNKSTVTAPDMIGSNGTIHVVDTVVMP